MSGKSLKGAFAVRKLTVIMGLVLTEGCGFVTAIVTAHQLKKYFGSLPAVDGINFTISSGECFGILGPNGAGKTTTVAMIYCFLPVGSGKLTVLGKDVRYHSREVKGYLGVVPQENNLDPELTVLGNLLIYASYFGIPRHIALERALKQLDFFGLTVKKDEAVEKLSGGMKRRLTIARGLMNDPDILILDEPTTGLDPEARHYIWQHLKHLKQGGLTVILTTHYLEEASQLCDKLIIMDAGKILEQGAPVALVSRHAGEQTVQVGIPQEYRGQLLDTAGPLPRGHLFIGDTAYLFPGDAVQEVMERISGMPQISYRIQRPANLEDVFLKLTGRGFGSE
jgi:lipooligosaccharide transport system ATP-binding protein